MFRRLFGSAFVLLALAVLVTLAVTNRKIVPLVLDPFTPDNPVLALELPFFAYLIGMLIIGAVVGGLAVWLSQAKWRKLARQRAQDSMKWKGEVDRLQRERDQKPTETRALTVVR